MALSFPCCLFYPSVRTDSSMKAEKQPLRFMEDERYSGYTLCADAGFALRSSVLIDKKTDTFLLCE